MGGGSCSRRPGLPEARERSRSVPGRQGHRAIAPCSSLHTQLLGWFGSGGPQGMTAAVRPLNPHPKAGPMWLGWPWDQGKLAPHWGGKSTEASLGPSCSVTQAPVMQARGRALSQARGTASPPPGASSCYGQEFEPGRPSHQLLSPQPSDGGFSAPPQR